MKEFINATLSVPVAYCLIWLVVFGGAGIRKERDAAQNGLCCAPNQQEGTIGINIK